MKIPTIPKSKCGLAKSKYRKEYIPVESIHIGEAIRNKTLSVNNSKLLKRGVATDDIEHEPTDAHYTGVISDSSYEKENESE